MAKIAASVKAVWEAAKKDFSENSHTELLKQDVLDVLEMAKNTATRVKRAPPPSDFTDIQGGGTIEPKVNQDVGAELLSHFKEEWAGIHQRTEEASAVANSMDVDLRNLNQAITRSHLIISRCRDEFSHLRDIVEGLDDAQSKVEAIGDLLRQVEEDIRSYSLAKAELTTERRKHSIQKQQEKVLMDSSAQVDQLRKVLLNEQQKSLDLKHDIENKELRERQNAFQEMFDKQMADYRKKGQVDRPIDEIRGRSQSQLEEVVLEDEDGTASLHEFLSDVNDVVLENTDPPAEPGDTVVKDTPTKSLAEESSPPLSND